MKKPKTMLEIFIEECEKDGMKVHICQPRPLGRRKKTPSTSTPRNGKPAVNGRRK